MNLSETERRRHLSHAVSASTLANRDTHPGYFLLRRLHSLTGVMFGGYICVHLLINATLIQGPHGHGGGKDVFQLQVDKIHSLPFLLAIELSFIFAPIVVHTLYGIYIMVNGKPNVGNYSYVKNWFYVMQRVTAVILIGFIVFHVGGMFGWFGDNALKFVPADAYRSTVAHIQIHWIVALIVYPLGVLAGTFHLANGFWAAGIAWGLTVSKQAQTRWGLVCIGLFLFTTACGFAAIAATFLYKADVLGGPTAKAIEHAMGM
jgi:succinate dehydrogenase/fumarate reductase cytochrome b subunit (b558 family)